MRIVTGRFYYRSTLDEAGTFPGGNVLGLPHYLPRGVYLVLGQQPLPIPLNIEPMPRRVELKADGVQNQEDMKKYLQYILAQTPIATYLEGDALSIDFVMRTLLRKSAGNWMYLYSVIQELLAGKRTLLELEELPSGLVGYYARYWQHWRDQPKWYELYAPLLATLAAAMEPVPLERLQQWAGTRENPHSLRRLLTEDWRAVILAINANEILYRFSHASHRDFFNGDNDPSLFPPAIEGLLTELQSHVQEAHKRIVMALRDDCAGNFLDLIDNTYGERYICIHLHRGGATNDLLALVNNPIWYNAKMASDPSGASYRSDLIEALHAAQSIDSSVAKKNQPATLLAQEIHCALRIAGLSQYSLQISTFVLPALVKFDLWPLNQALIVARQSPKPEVKAESFGLIAQVLPPVERDDVLNEALSFAVPIRGLFQVPHLQALIALLPYLTPPLVKRGLKMARKIERADWRAQALAAVAKTLPAAEADSIYIEAMNTVKSIESEYDQAWALEQMAPYLERTQLQEAIAMAKNLVGDAAREVALDVLYAHLGRLGEPQAAVEGLISLKDKSLRPQVLQVLAPTLSEDLLRIMIDQAATLKNPYFRDFALAYLIPHLAGFNHWEEALSNIRTLNVLHSQAKAIAILTTYLAKQGRSSDAFTLIKELKDGERWREAALKQFIPHMDPHLLPEVLTLVRDIKEDAWRSLLLTELISIVSEDMRGPVLQEAMDAARVFRDDGNLLLALAAFARYATTEIRDKVIDQIRAYKNPSIQADALEELAFKFDNSVRVQLASEVLVSSLKEQQGARINILRALLPSCIQVPNEAITLAYSIQDEHLRPQALCYLASFLSVTEYPTLADDAIEAARAIKDIGGRARKIAQAAALFGEEKHTDYLREALSLISSIEEEQERTNILKEICSYRNHIVVSDLIEATQGLENPYSRSDVLLSLAMHLPEGAIQELFETIRNAPGLEWRSVKLAELSTHVSEELQHTIRVEAVTAAVAIEDGERRSQVIGDILQWFPEGVSLSLLRNAATAAHLIWMPGTRREVWNKLVPILIKLNRQELYPIWSETLQVLAIGAREDFLIDLRGLAPIIDRLGGREAATEVASILLAAEKKFV